MSGSVDKKEKKNSNYFNPFSKVGGFMDLNVKALDLLEFKLTYLKPVFLVFRTFILKCYFFLCVLTFKCYAFIYFILCPRKTEIDRLLIFKSFRASFQRRKFF